MIFDVAEKAALTFLPVLLLAGVGYVYAGRFPQVRTDDLNAINLRVFLPLLVFNALTPAQADWGELGWIAVYGGAIVLGSGILTYPLCRLLGWKPREVVPPMMFSNYGNMGLPLLPLAFGAEALPAAVVLFIVGNTLHLTIGFKIYDNRLRWRELAGTPMLIAAVAGVAAVTAGWQPRGTVAHTLDMAGGVAIPLMLFALGVRLREVTWQMFRASIAPALWCPASGILCFAALWHIIPLPAEEKWVVSVFAALPPALLNYMFAERFQVNPSRVAAIVITGNLLSVAVIPLTLMVVFSLR